MSCRKFDDIDRLIHNLLDRHEANPNAERLLAYIDEDAFTSVEARDRFTAALLAAEKAGGITIRRRRVDGAMVLGHVALSDATALYTHAGRVPARIKANAALVAARERQDLPSTAQSIFEEIAGGWSRGVNRYGLAPHDGRGLQWYLIWRERFINAARTLAHSQPIFVHSRARQVWTARRLSACRRLSSDWFDACIPNSRCRSGSMSMIFSPLLVLCAHPKHSRSVAPSQSTGRKCLNSAFTGCHQSRGTFLGWHGPSTMFS